jgi:hypothetical protein
MKINPKNEALGVPKKKNAPQSEAPKQAKIPNLPKPIRDKISKTGQTRGADDDAIYQNRVNRNSTVLIPYDMWEVCHTPSNTKPEYENGFIVLISPEDYFSSKNIEDELEAKGLSFGVNALVFYETRTQWTAHNPASLGWTEAKQRCDPLGGQYVARVAAITSHSGERINRGFTTTAKKGAGIRVYEYATKEEIAKCRLQLEALFWACADSLEVAVANGMTVEDATLRKAHNLQKCQEDNLFYVAQLENARMLNGAGNTICPLCLAELSSQGFFNRMEQAEGRLVHDLTVTQLNLFHVRELRFGALNHRIYNLGWGHHHCNVVVKDSGIIETLHWMKEVVDRNLTDGQLPIVSSKVN